MLTAQERQLLKTIIDRGVRERSRDAAGCKGCGCEYDSYSKGCRTCHSRKAVHRRRMYPESKRRVVCQGCGGEYDSYTKGCRTCEGRHAHRRVAHRKKLYPEPKLWALSERDARENAGETPRRPVPVVNLASAAVLGVNNGGSRSENTLPFAACTAGTAATAAPANTTGTYPNWS